MHEQTSSDSARQGPRAVCRFLAQHHPKLESYAAADPNSASAEEPQTLKGVGPVQR